MIHLQLTANQQQQIRAAFDNTVAGNGALLGQVVRIPYPDERAGEIEVRLARVTSEEKQALHKAMISVRQRRQKLQQPPKTEKQTSAPLTLKTEQDDTTGCTDAAIEVYGQ